MRVKPVVSNWLALSSSFFFFFFFFFFYQPALGMHAEVLCFKTREHLIIIKMGLE